MGRRSSDTLRCASLALLLASPALGQVDRKTADLKLRSRMQRAVGSHFTVSFEGPAEEQLAVRALESIERAYWRIGATLSTYPVDPISVVLYSSEQFRDITRSPPWAGGAYDGTIRIPMRGALGNAKELDRVLAHELTHAFVHTLARRGVPAWLNEGLASALESDDLIWAEELIRKAGAPVWIAALQRSFRELTGREAQRAYAASSLVVRRLVDEAGGFAVANLLRDLGEGVDFETAFGHRMPRSFADFKASSAGP